MVIREVFLVLLAMLVCGWSAVRYDCCQPQLSSTGLGCTQSGTDFNNQTYYCVSVAEICPSCKISAFENITSSSCYQCCATGPEACGVSVSFISTSSWSKWGTVLVASLHARCDPWLTPGSGPVSFSRVFPIICSADMHHFCGLMLLLLHRVPVRGAQPPEGGADVPRGVPDPHPPRVRRGGHWRQGLLIPARPGESASRPVPSRPVLAAADATPVRR